MHLKRLTLRGFKSFASATTLNFEPGITCVVGPNGSGKSNVVDALSWVMGEQGAKSLRGGKMEDVIFAGTSGRAPLGRAEVVLTIDNTDGALPIDYTEVTISRTMFRNGGSEYAINGNSVRLLDVQDLLSDSGIGREMHVIVGQGQLDSILTATPEGRRGFIEEAAGVLKHRKRKEKALRKLESTEGNVQRLGDLIVEIRRQLKPLGRQAEVARKAALIQAEARDARARVLADDLVQATLSLEADLADEAALRQRRAEVEAALAAARDRELSADEAVREGLPRLQQAQETWYSLAALKERVATTVSIAAERVRNAADDPGEVRHGRDPEDLEREAAATGAQEAELAVEVAERTAGLADASGHRSEAEQAHGAEEKRLAGVLRAAADRREGLARLAGKVSSLRSRCEAAGEEIGRLTAARDLADTRAAEAQRAFTALESQVAGLDAGELGLDEEHESAQAALDDLDARREELRTEDRAAAQERAALTARLEALELGIQRKDGAAALLAAADSDQGAVDGLLGSVAALVSVEPGYETAVAAGFGTVADAVAVDDLLAAVGAVEHLKANDLGRAGLLVGGAAAAETRSDRPVLPVGARWAVEVVTVDAALRPAVDYVLRMVAVVATLADARSVVADHPEVVAVTREGDVLGAYEARGGSSAQPSLIEVQAAVDDARSRLEVAGHRCDRARFAAEELTAQHREASAQAAYTLARLHESDASMAALAEQLGQLSARASSARGEADRLAQAIADAGSARERDLIGLGELEARLAAAEDTADDTDGDVDPARRDALADAARLARAAEMDARLALRTVEERARALAGR
ncbi:MAG: AAA family ATPase, partial [Propionibacteriaceae bacterium]